MATNFELYSSFGASTAPPSYDMAVSTVTGTSPLLPLEGAQSRLSWMLRTPNKKRAIALSLIRDLVTTADFNPALVVPIVTSCAAALSPARFSRRSSCNLSISTLVVSKTSSGNLYSEPVKQTRTSSVVCRTTVFICRKLRFSAFCIVLCACKPRLSRLCRA